VIFPELYVAFTIPAHKNFVTDRNKVLSYGLPSAIILLTTLESITQDPSKISAILPTGIKISNLVRNMSVFVSQLENFSSPRETNQVFCLKAAKTISRRLNHTLENFPTHDFTLPSGSLPESSALNTTEDEVFTAIPDIDTIELEHLENFDTFDIADWAINFDIGSMNDDWTL
jgi:hypothetical protein